MPSDNRTQKPIGGAAHDPLDDLFAPITGGDVPAESAKTNAHSVTSNNRRRDPLDDLVTDAELRAEALQSQTAALSKDRARRNRLYHYLRMSIAIGLVGMAAAIVSKTQFGTRHRWGEWNRKPSVSAPRIQIAAAAKPVAGQNQAMEGSQFPVTNKPKEVPNLDEGLRLKDEKVATGQQKGSTPQTELEPVAQKLTPEELYEMVSPSIVRVNVRNERSKLISFGSGFFARDDSTVITNYHVIELASSAEVILHDGTSLLVLGVQGFDSVSDIAVLKVARGPRKSIRHLALGSNTLPPIGSKVYVIGAPEGLDSSLSDGLVSGRRERDGRLWIQISAPISPGSSGSPVLSDNGSVIGIATWIRHIEGQNLNFASPASGVAGLMTNNSRLQRFPALLLERSQILEDIYRKTKDTQLADGGRRIASQNALWQLDNLPASFRKDPMFWEYKGDIYFNQSQWDEAITEYRKGIAVDPDHPFLLGRIGEVYIIKQQYEDAVSALGRAVVVEENNDKLWCDFGRALLEVKRPKEAVDALRRSIAINPQKTSGHTTLGNALAELGDIEGGIAAYETALKLEPNDWICNFNYGNFLRRIGRRKDAIKAFERVRIMPGTPKQIQATCDSEIENARHFDRQR